MACPMEGLMTMHMKRAASHAQALGSPLTDDDDTQAELWYACAGPGKTLPPVNSVVAYFPQGHIEQVAFAGLPSSSTIAPFNKLDVEGQIPHYILPAVIRCTVDSIKLSADPSTDEVFATLTLFPNESSKPVERPAEPKRTVGCFEKVLTASDTSSHGGFAVPKRGAEEYLPPLDKSQDPPVQELVFKDLHGKEWKFKHIYRGEPKRHLFTTGWSVFVNEKRLIVGDVVLFLRGEDEKLRIGVRRAPRNQQVQSKVLTSPTMTIGVLAAAAHAAKEGIRFSLIYNPRSCPSEYVVPYAKYLEAVNNEFTVGQRFKMRFESEDTPERRHTGTIAGISEYDPVRWPNSLWRSIQVNWSESSSSETQNRVSPWEIEPFTACPLPTKTRTRKRIRPPQCQRQVADKLGDNNLGGNHGSLGVSQPQTLNLGRVLVMQGNPESRALTSSRGDVTHVDGAVPAKTSWDMKHSDSLKSETLTVEKSPIDWGHRKRADQSPTSEIFRGLPDRWSDLWSDMGNGRKQEEQLNALVVKAQPLGDVDLQLSLASSAIGDQQATGKSSDLPWSIGGSGRQSLARSQFPESFVTGWPSSYRPHSVVISPVVSSPDCSPRHTTSLQQADSGSSSHTSTPKSNFWEQQSQPDAAHVHNVAPAVQGEQKCKIFGVALDKGAAPVASVLLSESKSNASGSLDDGAKQSSSGCVEKIGASLNSGDICESTAIGEPEPENLVPRCKGAQNWQQGPVRSFTKVYMQGAIGRSIDVTKFEGYDELLKEVERMFELEGELVDKNSSWQLVYTDHEDDVLMVGDDPWLEFCSCVRSIRVVSRAVSDSSRLSRVLSGKKERNDQS